MSTSSPDPDSSSGSDVEKQASGAEKDGCPEGLERKPTANEDTKKHDFADPNRQFTAGTANSVGIARSRTVETIEKITTKNWGKREFTHTLEHQVTAEDVVVDFDGPDDPYKAINWPFKKKMITTIIYSLTTAFSAWGSAIFAPAVNQVADEFGISTQVSVIAVSLLLFGFGVGPLLWAPLSELYGRKNAIIVPYFIGACFAFGTAAAKDVQTIMLTRFFAGFFGSAPISNTGGVLADLWSPDERAIALMMYSIAVVAAPNVAPIAGGAIVQSYLGWRWTEYLTGIMMMSIITVNLIFVEETFPPVQLQHKARRLRVEKGNWALHAKIEEWDPTFKEIANKYLLRPCRMLCTPICLSICTYASFVYGLLYLNLSGFPVAFQEERGWNILVGQLPFLAVITGIFVGGAGQLYNQKFYKKAYAANNYQAVPEARLPPMMVGGCIFGAALFLFAWTSNRGIMWFPQIVGCFFFGLGFFCIYQCCLNYLTDTFGMYAASAIAANTFLRSFAAGGFQLFVDPMYRGMGIPAAVSLIAGVACALAPIPFVFYTYGPRLRARGKWSATTVQV